MMSAMEQSLRRALEAGDAGDPAFRETIYAASERALERMLAAKETDAHAAHAQRVRLAETINRVEEDYFSPPAEDDMVDATADDDGQAGEVAYVDLPPDVEEAGSGSEFGEGGLRGSRDEDETRGIDEHRAADRGAADRSLGEIEDELPRAVRRDPEDGRGDALPGGLSPAGAPEESAARDASWSPGGAKRGGAKPSRARPFLFGTIVLLLTLIAGLVFAYVTIFSAPGTGTGTGSPEAASSTGTATAPLAEPAEIAWINLFDGTQLEMIATPTGGEVSSITGRGDRPAVRLAAAGEEGEVDVAIGPGVVNGIKGRTVRVEVTVGSPDGTAREFTIRCLFGGDTVCGRQRFSTVQDGEAFVFDMTVPPEPAASGAIAIDPSFGTGAKAIDLYSVRLRTIEGA